MEKREFEQRYGKKVSDAFYSQIEKTYTASSYRMDKDKFCAGLKQIGDKHEAMELLTDLTEQVGFWEKNAKIQKQAADLATETYKTWEEKSKSLIKECKAVEEQLKDRIAENSAALVAMVVKARLYKEAIEIFGRKRVIAVKLTVGLELDAEDQGFIISEFS